MEKVEKKPGRPAQRRRRSGPDINGVRKEGKQSFSPLLLDDAALPAFILSGKAPGGAGSKRFLSGDESLDRPAL
jgi:hypothetical protein